MHQASDAACRTPRAPCAPPTACHTPRAPPTNGRPPLCAHLTHPAILHLLRTLRCPWLDASAAVGWLAGMEGARVRLRPLARPGHRL
eukprot:323719-Prymnesium_polylepis.1